MKKVIAVILALALSSAQTVFATEEGDVRDLKKDAVIYLDFDSRLPEGVTAHGNFNYTEGPEGLAGLFDGEDTYLKLPEGITEGVDEFTIGCWVRFDKVTPNVWQRVFDFGTDEGSCLYLGTWQWSGSDNVRGGTAISGGGQATSFGAYEIGEWVHYALVQRGDAMELYLNGRLAASAEALGRIKDAGATANNYIGFYNKNTEPTECFHGAVDEFFFAPYALDKAELNMTAFSHLSDEKKVQSLAARVYLRQEDGVFSYYSFDDGHSSVTWSSSKPDIMTENGIVSAPEKLTDVVLTAHVRAGDFEQKTDYEYVVGEFDGEIAARETTLEKIEIDDIRKTAKKIDTKKTYHLKAEGKYLTEKDGELYLDEDCTDGSLWRFAPSPKTNNTYAIFNVKSGNCFDVKDYSLEKGAEVIPYYGGKGINQLWYVAEARGKCAILSYQSEWFLGGDMRLHGLDDLTEWEIEEAENTLIQKGHEPEDPFEKYAALSDNSYYALRIGSGCLAAGEGTVFEKNYVSHKNAQWLVTNIEDKYYTVINRETGQNLNISGGSRDAGADVILRHGAAGANEQWLFEKTDKGWLISGRDNKNYLAYDTSLTMSETPFYWDVVKYSAAKEQPKKETEEENYLSDYVPPVREEEIEGFTHPGILVTKDDIVRMQTKVREGAEPWLTSFKSLAAASPENVRIYAYDSNADTTALKSEARLKNMRMDARAAANQALMYVITGKEAYRANTMTILNMWSELRDVYTTLGSDRIDHGEIAFKLAFAAELMKYTDCENPDLMWSEADNEKFVGMLETIRPKHDSWWYWMNQHSICNMGTMANAIFRNDRDLYEKAVVRTTVNPEGGGSMDCTRGSGGGIVQVFRIVDFDALNGDKIEPTFVHAEMGRDQGHAYGNLGALSICAMTSYRQGTRVDPETGELSESENAVSIFEFADDRLLQAADYIGKYNLGYDVLHPTIDVGSLYSDINDTNRGALYVAFGILYNYYKYEKEADMSGEEYRYLREAHEYHYPEGGQNDFYIGFSDLLFTPSDAKVDMAEFAREGESGSIWQMENYTAVNYGSAERCGEYAKIALTGDGVQLALTNGNYPPGGKSQIVLRVKTMGEAEVVIQNEHTVYAPVVHGIIPDTNGEWAEIAFDIQPEGVLRQRIFFLTFFGEGEIDVDYMKFI